LFPCYYDATQVEVPLQTITARERLLVAAHLGKCHTCRGQFAALCALSWEEEHGDVQG
jgi:predicted anti-sigma-YlaC factor YlaD